MNSGQESTKILLSIIFSAIIIGEADYHCSGGHLTLQQRKDIIHQHNEFRSQLIHGKIRNKDGKYMPKGTNMLKLTWSCDLEKSAQRWANQCKFDHSPKNQREGIGENIYYFRSIESVKDLEETSGIAASIAWWSEVQDNYPDNPSNKLTREMMDRTLYFTQMAWGKTEKIGCGIATHCDNGETLIVICHYSPGGNMMNELIYELGEPCKKDKDCFTKKCSKKSGLCKK